MMNEDRKFRVLLVNTDDMFRFKVTDVLQYENNMEIVGDCPSAKEALEKIGTYSPDIVVMDTDITGMNAADACRKFLKNDYNCDVLMFGKDHEYVADAMKAGASWYFTKDIESRKLASVFKMTCKWQCMKSSAGERCDSLKQIASMITEHLTDSDTVYDDKTENKREIELIRHSEEDGDNIKEVTIKISVPHGATQLLRFYHRIEETLQSGITETVGSRDGTCIRLNLEKPFALPVIVDIIEGLPEVEKIQNVSEDNEISLTLSARPVFPVRAETPAQTEKPRKEAREMAGTPVR